MKTYSATKAIRESHQRERDLQRMQRANPDLEVTEVDEPRVTVMKPEIIQGAPVIGAGDRRARRARDRDQRRRQADSIRAYMRSQVDKG